MKTPRLLDQFGRPIEMSTLKVEVAAPTTTGVRSPLTSYPGDGLNPVRLASILREADSGDPVRYLELAETVEERDPHFLGVLRTRRQSVSQIDITVEAASDETEDVARADMVREWLKRDELTEEIFHILDCIGKGYSFTEIIWDTSSGEWMPERLEYRDPRWFRFERRDLATPVLLGESGQEQPLPGFKFIAATIKAKSGLALRGGLARVAMWGWMFKAFTQRDWAVFTQTFGQPVRVGKFGAGATDEDKRTLMRAVSNIAGDMAAIIPESMVIEFIQAPNVGASSDLYLARANWLDQQISKAVLGQTATTDAIAGGHAVGQEHRKVQEDIERADAKALAAILNRDLIRPWMQLNFGPLKAYPRLIIARPQQEDLSVFSTAISGMIDRGLEVEQSEVRDKFGLSEPKSGAKLMRPSGAGAPAADPADPNSKIKRNPGEIKRGEPLPGMVAAPQAEGPLAAISGAPSEAPSPVDLLTDRLAGETAMVTRAMLVRMSEMMDAAQSLPELAEMVRTGFPELDSAQLAALLAQALLAADLAGRSAVENEDASA